jgi:hypothetical protein
VLDESFEQPDAWIVAGKDPRGPEQIAQRSDDLSDAPIHPLGERLQDEMVAVAIDDEGWEAICFAVDETAGCRVDAERRAIVDRRLQPVMEKRRRRRVGSDCDDTQRDFGSIAEERVRNRPVARAPDLDEIAGGRVDAGHVAAIDPRMPGAHAILATAADADGRHPL